jgi:hypothetical protein
MIFGRGVFLYQKKKEDLCIIYLFIYLSGVGSKTTMSNEHLILMKWSRDFFGVFFPLQHWLDNAMTRGAHCC